MSIEKWNVRFSSEEYVYGTEPNLYFKKKLDDLIPGRVLLPAEGEGRNAVYAALLGWDVEAFDISDEGKKKALKLADKKGVSIDYQIAGFEDVEYPFESFDCIALLYTHMSPVIRKSVFVKLMKYLKPGGVIILEGFEKHQIEYNSGGPKDITWLYSIDELTKEFESLRRIDISERKMIISEGEGHSGNCVVVSMFGRK